MTTGRVVRVNGPLIEIEGLVGTAALDVLEVGAARLAAEVVAIRQGLVTAQAFEYTGGLRVGDTAVGLGHPLSVRLGPGLLGGIYDGLLRPLAGRGAWLTPQDTDLSAPAARWRFDPAVAVGAEVAGGSMIGTVTTAGLVAHRVIVPPEVGGSVTSIHGPGEVEEGTPVAFVDEHPVPLVEWWPVRRPRPVWARLEPSEPLVTGQRVLDLLYPVAKGGTAAVPGGFGTGKTVLLQQVVKWADADVVVFVGCGERGNELADALADLRALEDVTTGHRLLERTVVIANTSNMPVMAREASIYTGMTVAEYFRDMGYHAVLLADSTSRWAEALREFSSRSGELPAEEGYPAGLASSLAAFYERAGLVRTLGGLRGSVTAIGAVSPPGGDLTEPVTSHTERFVRTLWSLDRDLAYGRHYPAVTWHRSFARDAGPIGDWYAASGHPDWADHRARAMALLADADRLEAVVELVGLSGLPADERMVLLAGRLVREAVLQQSALSPNDATCTADKQSALLEAVLAVFDRCAALVRSGVSPATVERVDFSDLARVRDDVGPSDASGVRRCRDEVVARLEGLA